MIYSPNGLMRYNDSVAIVDDMPLLSQWIKKFQLRRLGIFWRLKQGSKIKLLNCCETSVSHRRHLRCPKVITAWSAYNFRPRRLCTPPFFRHRRWSAADYLLRNAQLVKQGVTAVSQNTSYIKKPKRKTIHKGWFSFCHSCPKKNLSKTEIF
jgi:hypothetical protein